MTPALNTKVICSPTPADGDQQTAVFRREYLGSTRGFKQIRPGPEALSPSSSLGAKGELTHTLLSQGREKNP